VTAYTLTTEQFAKIAGVTPHSVHAALTRRGGYAGIVPVKNASGHLRWPSDAAERLQPRPREFKRATETA
jgi:hypothetical protein